MTRRRPTRDEIVLRLETASLGAGRWPTLGRRQTARQRRDADLGFFLANQHTGTERLHHLNRLLRRVGAAPVLADDPPTLASLRTATQPATVDGLRVSVIVPTYNASATLALSLRSLLAQTWRDLEIVVVDDASTDDSVEIARTFDDPRIRVLVQSHNAGTYAARNRGLAEATGDYVTVHDADDWAHPERIERQVHHLLAHPDLVATTSTLVRATENLVFTRRDLTHSQVLGVNTASLLVGRATLLALGGWDTVRAGADSELVDRLRAVHGARSVEQIHPTAPLTVALRSESTLTASATTGLASQLAATGARRLYHAAYTRWHGRLGDDPRLVRADAATPFFAPALVRSKNAQSHLDVVILSDFSLPGGTTTSNLAEIAANEKLGLTTGLVHNRNPRPRPQPINGKILDALSTRTVMLSDGERVTCDVLVIKYPPSVMEIPDRFPQIEVRGDIVLAANQTPFANYGADPEFVYDIGQCDAEVRRVFGKAPIWAPIGPAVRQALHQHHAAEIAGVRLADDDWVEIIDVDAWRRPRITNSKPRIGRHGRDSVWKWPATAKEILAVYPDSDEFVVDILGGADTVKQVVGRIPKNWVVREYDAIDPADYLAQLVVFVYFPHPDMVEGFGRTIIEAMAAGVPCVVDQRFESLFGDNVIACPASYASETIRSLLGDRTTVQQLVDRAREFVETTFGVDTHRARLRAHSVN